MNWCTYKIHLKSFLLLISFNLPTPLIYETRLSRLPAVLDPMGQDDKNVFHRLKIPTTNSWQAKLSKHYFSFLAKSSGSNLMCMGVEKAWHHQYLLLLLLICFYAFISFTKCILPPDLLEPEA